MRQKLSIEHCFTEATKHQSRSSFAKLSPSAYQKLWREKLLDQACSHMSISPIYVPAKWCREDVMQVALKYKNRAEFKREESGAYTHALSNSYLEAACAHMRRGMKVWHVFELRAVAIKYQRKHDFIRKEPLVYSFCVKHKLLDLVCGHMEQAPSWTHELVAVEALKYETRDEFCRGSGGAFMYAHRNSIIDEVCRHMRPGDYGFSKTKPANLYQIRIEREDGLVVYKVGITNRDPSVRLKGMRVERGCVATLEKCIQFAVGRDARMIEKRLHKEFMPHRYTGLPLMHNGNTELFTVPLF